MGLSRTFNRYELIMAGRFVIGLNCGFNSGLCPMYINELSPVQIRGSIGVLFQLGVTSSILLSQVLGLPEIFGNSSYWPLLLGLTGIFSVYQLATLPFCPESPRYMVIKCGFISEAESALRRLRGSSDVKQEIDDMLVEAEHEKLQPAFRVWQLFTTRALLVPTLISIVLHLSQQLSGINAVFYYSSSILNKTGFQNVNKKYYSKKDSKNIILILSKFLFILTFFEIVKNRRNMRLHLLG